MFHFNSPENVRKPWFSDGFMGYKNGILGKLVLIGEALTFNKYSKQFPAGYICFLPN